MRNIREDRLKLATELEEAGENAENVFLALSIPSGSDDIASLKYISWRSESSRKFFKKNIRLP